MDLRQLRYFIAIVEEGSITAAAQRLNVAQPALSHHLRNLEKDLGVRLLVRGAHGVRPTAAGTRLYEHAVVIHRHVSQAQNDVRGYADEPQGAVAVGLPASVALVLAVPLVEAVSRRLPRVSLRILEGMSGSILEWLNNGRLDLALLYDVAHQKTLATEPLLTEDLHLVGPAGSGGTDIPFQAVAALPLVMPGRPHGLREHLERAARDQGVGLNVRVEIDGLPQIKTLVGRGAGFAVLSLSAVGEECRRGELAARRIVDPTLARTVSLNASKGRPPNDAADAVRSLLYTVMRDLVANDTWPGEALF